MIIKPAILIFIVAILVGLGAYYFGYDKGYEKSVNQNVATQEATVKRTSTIPDGWKMYENKDLGVSFAYPAELVIESKEDNGVQIGKQVEQEYIDGKGEKITQQRFLPSIYIARNLGLMDSLRSASSCDDNYNEFPCLLEKKTVKVAGVDVDYYKYLPFQIGYAETHSLTPPWENAPVFTLTPSGDEAMFMNLLSTLKQY